MKSYVKKYLEKYDKKKINNYLTIISNFPSWEKECCWINKPKQITKQTSILWQGYNGMND